MCVAMCRAAAMKTKHFALVFWVLMAAAGSLGAAPRASPATPEATPAAAPPDDAPVIEGQEEAPIAAAATAQGEPTDGGATASQADVFAGLPRGDAQLDALCARGHQDPVSERLCARPRVEGLADLQRAVGVA